MLNEKLDISPDFEAVRRNSEGCENVLRNAEGGGLTISEFAARLVGKTSDDVAAYLKSGDLFSWKHSNDIRIPAWQIHKGKILPGLREVLAIVVEKEPEPLSTIAFFTAKSDDLENNSPLNLLRKNRVKDVVDFARRYGGIGC